MTSHLSASAVQYSARSSAPSNIPVVEEINQKRHLRERHFTNYNEDYIQFDNVEFDERPSKRGRTEQSTAVPSISASHLELETAWAVVVNAGESILDEEEDLLPAGAHEQLYVQVSIAWNGTPGLCVALHVVANGVLCPEFTLHNILSMHFCHRCATLLWQDGEKMCHGTLCWSLLREPAKLGTYTFESCAHLLQQIPD